MMFSIVIWVIVAAIIIGMLFLGLHIPSMIAAALAVEATAFVLILVAAIIVGLVIVIRFLFTGDHAFGVGSLLLGFGLVILVGIVLNMTGIDGGFLNLGETVVGMLS